MSRPNNAAMRAASSYVLSQSCESWKRVERYHSRAFPFAESVGNSLNLYTVVVMSRGIVGALAFVVPDKSLDLAERLQAYRRLDLDRAAWIQFQTIAVAVYVHAVEAVHVLVNAVRVRLADERAHRADERAELGAA